MTDFTYIFRIAARVLLAASMLFANGAPAFALYDVGAGEIPGKPGSIIRIWPLEGGGPGMNGNGEAFRILYREGLILPAAVAKLDKELGEVDVIQEMVNFLRGCTKGINPMRGRLSGEAA